MTVHAQSAKYPTILELLTQEYCRLHGAAALHKEAQDFLLFAENYLKTNRPTSVFAADANYGIQLSNNNCCLVSPPVTVMAGDVDSSGSIPITKWNHRTVGPDYSRDGQGPVDKTMERPVEKLDQGRPFQRDIFT